MNSPKRTRLLPISILSAVILALTAIFAAGGSAHELEEDGLSAELDWGIGTLSQQLSLPASEGAGMAAATRAGTKNFRKFDRKPIYLKPRNKAGKRRRAEGSDFAFRGNLMVAGSYQGIGLYRLRKQGRQMRQISFYRCEGAQGDVTLKGDTVFYSIDSRSSNTERSPVCNNTKTNRGRSSVGKEGLRIISIKNLRKPRQVGFLETECGSHTQSLIPGKKRSHIYVQSYPLGPDDQCTEANHDEGELSVVRFPNRAPRKAKVLGVRDVFAASPAAPSFVTNDVVGCHDIGVLPRKDLAAAACLGAFALLDISNPAKPKTLGVVENPQMQLDHSAAFTWDGKYMVIGDEFAGAAGGGGCSPDQNNSQGAMWYYKTSDVRGASLTNPATEVGSYSLPRVPETDTPEEVERYRCTTHNYSILPMRNEKRYIAVSPYYSGGLSVVDFSNPANPKEIGWTIPRVKGRNPDMWSGYWYRGKIYSNEHATKLGVSSFAMKGLGRKQVKPLGRSFNPQTQTR